MKKASAKVEASKAVTASATAPTVTTTPSAAVSDSSEKLKALKDQLASLKAANAAASKPEAKAQVGTGS